MDTREQVAASVYGSTRALYTNTHAEYGCRGREEGGEGGGAWGAARKYPRVSSFVRRHSVGYLAVRVVNLEPAVGRN